MRRVAVLVVAATALTVAACGGESREQDLREWVKETDQLPRERIPPLPDPASPASPQRFDAFNLPDPFQPKGQPSKVDESTRRARSLLARYATVEEIDTARSRARANLELAIAASKSRGATIRSSGADLSQKLASYKDGKQPPREFTAAVKEHEARLQVAEKELESLTQELAGLDARFDADRKRYLELSSKK